MLDKEVDELVSVLLKELVRFQDRQYHKDPLKVNSITEILLKLSPF